MTARVRPLRDLLACLLGPAIWAVHFFIVYGAETIVCMATASATRTMRWSVFAVTLVALAVMAMHAAHLARRGRGRNDTDPFLLTLTLTLTALSASAIVAVALSAWRLGACVLPTG